MLILKNIYDWMGKQVHSKYADLTLGLLFFIEAIFFIPVDPILILYCLEQRKKAIWYATIATITSTLGGITAYYIGNILWDSLGIKIIHALSSIETFEQICYQYKIYEYWAVLIAGFTPFPYKIVTLTAGFCRLPLLPFIICSIIGRGARFFLVAILIKIYGDKIKTFIDKYFNQLVLIFTLLIILTISLIKLK